LSVHGTVTMSLQLGAWRANHTFTVADIQTGPVLGADFLASHNMTVDLRSKCLDWGTGHAPPTISRRGYEQHRGILREDVTVPGAHRVMATASVVDEEGTVVPDIGPSLFEPSVDITDRKGVLVARALVNV
jgi:hypothetical protein